MIVDIWISSEISYNVSEMTYDTSANWPEMLAKLLKPLAKRLVSETTAIPAGDSWALERFLGGTKKLLLSRRYSNCNKSLNSVSNFSQKCFFIDSNLLVTVIDDRMYDLWKYQPLVIMRGKANNSAITRSNNNLSNLRSARVRPFSTRPLFSASYMRPMNLLCVFRLSNFLQFSLQCF